MKIFDCQIDVGKNLFGPNSDLDIYLKEAPTEICYAIAIPTGTHILKIDDYQEISCVWEMDPKLKFYQLKKYIDYEEKIYSPNNPYHNMNKFVLEEIRKINTTNEKIKFYFAPKFHPHLDNKSGIQEFLYSPETIAVKIQGVSSFSSPFDIPKWLVDLLKEKNIPLMVHTGFYLKKNVLDTNRNPFLDYITNLNNSLNWAVFCLENNIQIYLAHGLRLSAQAAKIVNDCSNILVGIGPDYMLNKEQEALHLEKDYLDTLFDMINPKKLAFNTDFAWNCFDRNNWRERDWDSHKRIIKIMQQKGLDEYVVDIFYDNAANFFRTN